MTDRPKICFDRVLPRELMRPQSTTRAGGRVRAISPIGKAWMNGSTLRVRFMGGTPARRPPCASRPAGGPSTPT